MYSVFLIYGRMPLLHVLYVCVCLILHAKHTYIHTAVTLIALGFMQHCSYPTMLLVV